MVQAAGRATAEIAHPQKKIGGLLPLYALALFASAFLTFWIQPLAAKILLPRYGGSSAVWTTAALFFQVMLLAGYLYAHLASRLALRRQLLLHAALAAAAGSSLPVALAAAGDPASAPVTSLLATLALGLGLPFFVMSATAPLLQQWFSRTGHAHAADPYFLYSASNAGSLLALIAYPLAFETLLGLGEQRTAWSLACVAFAALLLACGFAAWRLAPVHDKSSLEDGSGRSLPVASPTWRQRAAWLLLAFAPSSLLLGVTQHITSEIAAAPLLWLVPFTLYVLTFVLAFARRSRVPAGALHWLQPIGVILLALAWPLNNFAWVLLIHLAVFALTALLCHAELARTRPGVAHLTSFYLWIALGGALGGAFNALIAPVVFNSVLEYPLALALACALRHADLKRRASDFLPALILAAGFALLVVSGMRPFTQAWTTIVYLQVIGLALYLAHHRPLRFALMVLVVLVATPLVHTADRVLLRERSFFGVHTVLRDETGAFNILLHGITIHGAQWIDPEKRARPISYFHPDSPIAQVLSIVGRDGGLPRVAVVGMGAGTLACHRAPGRSYTFFEIDPLVVRLAQDTRYFTFLADCAPQARIVLGDGRLSLAAEPPASYDLIIMDSFSSDAVPAHMITREALALYLSRTSPSGIVAFQITNQYLDLVPPLARLAADAGVTAYMPGPRFDIVLGEKFEALPSSWVIMTRDASRLAPLIAEESWEPVPPARGRPWTDDFSNVLGALK